MPRTNYQFFDGLKSIPINSFPEEAWTTISGDDNRKYRNHQKMYSAVGILNRCISLRSNALAAMPWSIKTSKGKEVYNSNSGPLPDEYSWLKGFRRTIYLTEASLTIFAQSYILIDGLLLNVQALRWLMPTSMEAIWDESEGLIGFKRTISSDNVKIFTPEKICYLTTPNPFHETAIATSPVQAALQEAGVIFSLNDFSAKFFERGAVKATVLKVDASVTPNEREKLKSWWKRFTGGVKNAWTSEVISSAVEPIVIGEGIAELADANITDSKAKTIATTLGVPHAIVFSDAANFATAEVDERAFYTHTIVPDARLIEEELNEKLFAPRGLIFGFDEEEIGAFQENEKDRADVVKAYTDAGIPLSIAVQIAGVQLPEGISPEDLDPEEPEEPEEATPEVSQDGDSTDINNQSPPNADANSDTTVKPQTDAKDKPTKEWTDESARLERWIKKRLDSGVKSWSLTDFNTTLLDSAQKVATLLKFLNPSDDDGSYRNLKAITLQVDPDDDEKEQDPINKTIAKATKPLADELAIQKDLVFEGNEGLMDADPAHVDMGRLMGAPDRITSASGPAGGARDALRSALIEASDLGVKTAVDQFKTVGYGFNWMMANQKARAWANDHASATIQGIDETTAKHVRQQIAQWIENGDDLSALSKELEVVFGRDRAHMIAATEVTRAYAQANKIAYKESGVVSKVEWRTANDEKVCPICGPLDRTEGDVETGFDAIDGFPPAHPHCRCWIVPIVSNSDDDSDSDPEGTNDDDAEGGEDGI